MLNDLGLPRVPTMASKKRQLKLHSMDLRFNSGTLAANSEGPGDDGFVEVGPLPWAARECPRLQHAIRPF